jgi:hypothetical protein
VVKIKSQCTQITDSLNEKMLWYIKYKFLNILNGGGLVDIIMQI